MTSDMGINRKIVLISCVSKKNESAAAASNLYTSALFVKSLNYARKQNPDMIFVLSALYGLVPIDKEIDPYNKTLNKMSSKENLEWAGRVTKSLEEICDLENDEFVFLAGNNYRKNIIPKIKKYIIPMFGLTIGRQLQFLGENHE